MKSPFGFVVATIFGLLVASNTCPTEALAQEPAHPMFLDMHQKSLERAKMINARAVISEAESLIAIAPDIVANALELSESQQTEIRELQESTRKKLKEDFGIVVPSGAIKIDQVMTSENFARVGSDEVPKLIEFGNSYRTQLVNIFVPSQLEKVTQMSLAFGLSKTVADSPVGSLIELTDLQREKIKKRSNKLADEVEELVAKIRAESKAIVQEELTESQWRKLEKLYGKKLDAYPEFGIETYPEKHRFANDE